VRKVSPPNEHGDLIELSEEEKQRFYRCPDCGEMVDRRQLDDVLFHERHVDRPGIPLRRFGTAPRIAEQRCRTDSKPVLFFWWYVKALKSVHHGEWRRRDASDIDGIKPMRSKCAGVHESMRVASEFQ